ncbi:type II toxin-antitoxin system RelE/ParE family toxin, partial [Pseudomonas fluorescens]
MRYSIVWRPMAVNDLDGIIDYIAKGNPTRAETFGQELREKAQKLADHPMLGRSGRP